MEVNKPLEESEAQKKYDPYDDLRKVAGLQIYPEQDETDLPVNDLTKIIALENLNNNGLDLSVLGIEVVKDQRRKKFVVQESKKADYETFVKWMNNLRRMADEKKKLVMEKLKADGKYKFDLGRLVDSIKDQAAEFWNQLEPEEKAATDSGEPIAPVEMSWELKDVKGINEIPIDETDEKVGDADIPVIPTIHELHVDKPIEEGPVLQNTTPLAQRVESQPVMQQTEVRPVVKKDVSESQAEATPRKEEKKNKALVWYDGIVDDLVAITLSDDNLTDEKLEERRKITKKLEDKGVHLPELSTDITDKEADWNRQVLKGAVEFLTDKILIDNWGGTRKQAIEYLNRLGIGEEGKGVAYLPGSVEAKEKELEQTQPVENDEKEKAESQGRADIYGSLIDLAEFEASGDKENLVSLLEGKGVKNIRKFMGDLEIMGEGEKKEIMAGLRNVVDVWMMDSTEKLKYPEMVETAKLYARELGLE